MGSKRVHSADIVHAIAAAPMSVVTLDSPLPHSRSPAQTHLEGDTIREGINVWVCDMFTLYYYALVYKCMGQYTNYLANEHSTIDWRVQFMIQLTWRFLIIQQWHCVHRDDTLVFRVSVYSILLLLYVYEHSQYKQGEQFSQ